MIYLDPASNSSETLNSKWNQLKPCVQTANGLMLNEESIRKVVKHITERNRIKVQTWPDNPPQFLTSFEHLAHTQHSRNFCANFASWNNFNCGYYQTHKGLQKSVMRKRKYWQPRVINKMPEELKIYTISVKKCRS